MEIQELFKGCYLVVLPTQRELGTLFLRFQEHYESANKDFRKRAFTLEEFKIWYTSNYGKNGQFSNYEDWSGFNIPGYILKPFYDGKFKDITPEEQRLLDFFKDRDLKEIYIIGVSREDKFAALDHEKSHALFYLDFSYRFRAKILQRRYWRQLAPIRKMLKEMGYSRNVIEDETNAYLCFEEETLVKKGIDTNTKAVLILQRTLKRMYKIFLDRHENG